MKGFRCEIEEIVVKPAQIINEILIYYAIA
jgi:hypothetical protein